MPMSIRPSFGRQETNDASSSEPTQLQVTMESVTTTAAGDGSPSKNSDEIPTEEVQAGVKKAEAITISWTKTSLAVTLVAVWFITLANGFRNQIIAQMQPFAVSDFQSHSLLTVIQVVSSAITAAIYIPMAKLVDMWGRAESFATATLVATIGMAILAASNSLATYCAGTVFLDVGRWAAIYASEIVVIDATSLRNRGLAFAFTSSPYLVTAFGGPAAAQSFFETINWRWAYGTFAIITPIIAAPFFATLVMNLNKAKKQGLISTKSVASGRTLLQTVWYIIVQFDLLGVLLFAGGLVTFLVPFNIAAYAPNGWSTDYIIAMIVVGFFLLVLFGLEQYFVAPVPFFPWEYLRDRTVVGSCLINACYQTSYFSWNYYFTSFLQVVFNLSISEAGYINNIFSMVSGILLFVVGWSIRRTGYYRWLFYVAVPLYCFALGLMIHFREPNGNIGYIVMCEIFISIAGSVFILICQLTILTAVDHQHTATAVAILFVSGSIGGAIGGAISGAIWTNTFIPALMRNLPESELANAAMIAGDLTTQLSYESGSETRYAIQYSYGFGQTRMLATGVAFGALSLIWMFFIKNVNVLNMKQTKGTVF